MLFPGPQLRLGPHLAGRRFSTAPLAAMSSRPAVHTVHAPTEIDFSRAGTTHYLVAFHHDGTWGNVLVPLTVINGRRGPGKTVAVFGGTHGNEYEGQVAVWKLARELDPARLAGRVLLLPRFCTPACDAGTRESPLDGVNMNRAFPGNPRGSITCRIAHFATTEILNRADVVLDLHSGGRILRFPMVSSFHEVACPQQLAEMARVARLFDTPFIMVYASAMASGLLTDEAEAMGKITIGTELGYGEATIREGVRHAEVGVRNVLRHYGLLSLPEDAEHERVRPAGSPPARIVRAVRLEDYVPAPISGIYEPTAEPGQRVEAGELVGRLYDFDYAASAPVEMRAPRAGWLLVTPFAAAVERGQTVLVVAEEVDYG
jgi:predicted deacylase